MMTKEDTLELARKLDVETCIGIDSILQKFKITHIDYRAVYPDTPVSPGLALDIIDARETEQLTLKQLKRRYKLTDSQLNYALYNDEAIKTHEDTFLLPRTRVLADLRKGTLSQTAIAKLHDVSQSFVHQIAKSHDLLPNNRKKRVALTKQQKQAISACIKNGGYVDELAKEYNVSPDTIYKFLRGQS